MYIGNRINPEAQYNLRIQPVKICSQTDWFAWQIEKLVKEGVCEYWEADPFRKRIKEFGFGNFVFIPIPPMFPDFTELMAKVKLNNETGINHIGLLGHENLDPVITTPSILVDVDDGGSRLNISQSLSRANILAEGRHPFCTWRGIIYAILFPWCLLDRGLYLVGSQNKVWHDSKTTGLALETPALYLGTKGPELCSHNEYYACSIWGAPSCGKIILP